MNKKATEVQDEEMKMKKSAVKPAVRVAAKPKAAKASKEDEEDGVSEKNVKEAKTKAVRAAEKIREKEHGWKTDAETSQRYRSGEKGD